MRISKIQALYFVVPSLCVQLAFGKDCSEFNEEITALLKCSVFESVLAGDCKTGLAKLKKRPEYSDAGSACERVLSAFRGEKSWQSSYTDYIAMQYAIKKNCDDIHKSWASSGDMKYQCIAIEIGTSHGNCDQLTPTYLQQRGVFESDFRGITELNHPSTRNIGRKKAAYYAQAICFGIIQGSKQVITTAKQPPPLSPPVNGVNPRENPKIKPVNKVAAEGPSTPPIGQSLQSDEIKTLQIPPDPSLGINSQFTRDEVLGIQHYSDEIYRLCPPQTCVVLALGRSPTPLAANIQMEKPNYLWNLPLSDLRDLKSDTLPPELEQNLAAHFDRVLPSPAILSGKKVLVVDYVNGGTSVVRATKFLQEYMNKKFPSGTNRPLVESAGMVDLSDLGNLKMDRLNQMDHKIFLDAITYGDFIANFISFGYKGYAEFGQHPIQARPENFHTSVNYTAFQKALKIAKTDYAVSGEVKGKNEACEITSSPLESILKSYSNLTSVDYLNHSMNNRELYDKVNAACKSVKTFLTKNPALSPKSDPTMKNAIDIILKNDENQIICAFSVARDDSIEMAEFLYSQNPKVFELTRRQKYDEVTTQVAQAALNKNMRVFKFMAEKSPHMLGLLSSGDTILGNIIDKSEAYDKPNADSVIMEMLKYIGKRHPSLFNQYSGGGRNIVHDAVYLRRSEEVLETIYDLAPDKSIFTKKTRSKINRKTPFEMDPYTYKSFFLKKGITQ